MADDTEMKLLLHLVFRGELKTPGGIEFRDPDALDIVGASPDHQSATGGRN